MKPKEQKRSEAAERQTKRDLRTDREQMERLRLRRGDSKREIRRLMNPEDKPRFLQKITQATP